MTTPALAAQLQTLQPSAAVELFHLDLNPIGVAVEYFFTPNTDDGVALEWDGDEYAYAQIELTGVETSAEGEVSEPRFRIDNTTKFASALVVQYNDLVGAKLTRWKTFADFLDGAPLADPDAYLSRDVFRVFQKLNINKAFAEFALRPIYALDGRMLPGRVCLKNICTHRYRDGSTGSFDYSKATCPYVGANKFKADGTATSVIAEDVCGKQITDCELRFPSPAPLPTRAFPGMSRIRV